MPDYPGADGYKPALPAVPGTEALGIVDALGEGVKHLKLGQRVASAAAQAAWAECFISPAAKLVPVPDALPDEAACQLLAMPLSALMLLEDMKLQPGQWIVQNAANGAVGKVLATLAAARGIGVVNLVRRESAGQIMSLLAENGELSSFGSLTFKPLAISGGDLIFKQAVVKGYWASKRLAATPPAELARMIGELAGQVVSGVLKLPVGGVFGLADAAAAMAAAKQVGRTGKVLLKGS